ncbi:MAG: Fic family protein [Herpetosiphon sp.]|nr:Fic family protein [Herpetosiphon sp.]
MTTTAGRYIQSLAGYRTFVPNRLPPPLTITPELARLIETTIHALGRVEMCRTLLPNIDLLIYSSLQREAIASSTIEGTIASVDELVRFQALETAERQAVREVANYVNALVWGCEQLQTRPISANMMLGLHERLLDDVRGANQAGQFKRLQNYIGSHVEGGINAAIFVPPPPEFVQDLIDDLEAYINAENRESRLVQCALAHYQFETIHPFHDGNGRVGRLLIILQLIQLGLLTAPLIYPSVYFERRRETYYQLLQSVREQSLWEDWLIFFVTGIKNQCDETIQLTQLILDLREQLRQTIINARRKATMNEVLNAFFQHPLRSVREISDHTHLAHTTIQPALDDLSDLGIVEEITGRQRGRMYVCRPILHAIMGG